MKLIRKRRHIFGKNSIYITIGLLITLMITIGYAYLNSSLNIVGNSSMAANTWNVHFENIQIKEGSKSDANVEIVNSSTTVNFDINLEEQGEYLDFTVDIVNNGTINAMLSNVVNTGISEASKAYLDYSLTYIDGQEIKENDLLEAGVTERIHVIAKYKDNIDTSLLPEDDVVQEVTLSINYVQSDENSHYRFIPDEYQKIEYLETTGKQYIDTDFYPTNKSYFEIKFSVAGWSSGNIGCRKSLNNNDAYIRISNTTKPSISVMLSTSGVNSTVTFLPINVIEINKNDRQVYINGALLGQYNGIATFKSDYSYILFGFNDGGTIGTTGIMKKIYECILKDEGIEKHFVPCLDANNVPCMYDIISKQTFYNAGTGTFKTGPIVH